MDCHDATLLAMTTMLCHCETNLPCHCERSEAIHTIKMSLIKLTPEISYLPSVEAPLSSDVVFIKPQDSDTTWIFDVGSCGEAAQLINQIEGKKNIVISHFHPDHIINLLKVKYDKLYVTKYTKKYTRAG